MPNTLKFVWAMVLTADLVLLGGCSTPGVTGEAPSPAVTLPASATWRKLDTVPFRGKQDDIYFVTPRVGWYGNGSGKIYKTLDGGMSWVEQLSKPGTFVRG